MYRNPYEVLGIARDASLAEAEDAYHRLMRQEHPDVHHHAGPDRVATAELRTRDLNAAIAAVRADRAARADVGATRTGTSATTGTTETTGTGPDTGRAPGGDGGPTARTHATERGRRDASSGAGGWRPPPDAAPQATCPWCGRPFARASELKDHVFGEHDLRLDPRRRGSLLGGRMHRLGQKFSHLPLWGVIPVNLAVAVVVALLVTMVTDETVGLWAGVIVMAPTVVALVDRLFDIDI
jgi:hypothetical protein